MLREASFGQSCWVCKRNGTPIKEPGWFEVAFHPVGSTSAPWSGPVIHNSALCPEHAEQVARFLERLKAEAEA